MAFTRPAGTLVYAEDVAGVTSLGQVRDTNPAANIYIQDPLSVPWVAPTGLKAPSVLLWCYGNEAYQSTGVANPIVLFLHERSTPKGEARLVRVAIEVSQSFDTAQEPAHSDHTDRAIHTRRLFVASACTPNGNAPSRVRNNTPTLLDVSSVNGDGTTITTLRKGGPPLVQYQNRLRLYAGQSDPKDASRFSIPYVLDGEAGRIGGHLNDSGTVELVFYGPIRRLPIEEQRWRNDAGNSTVEPVVRQGMTSFRPVLKADPTKSADSWPNGPSTLPTAN